MSIEFKLYIHAHAVNWFSLIICAGWTSPRKIPSSFAAFLPPMSITEAITLRPFFATNTKQIWNQDVCLFSFSWAFTHFFVVRAQVALMLPSKQHEVPLLLLIPSNIYTQVPERRILRNRKKSNCQLIPEIHRKASRCPFDLCAPSLIFTTQCFFRCWIYILFLLLNRVMHILLACLVPSEGGITPYLCV